MTNKENVTYSTGKKVAKIDIKTGEIIKIYNSIQDTRSDTGAKKTSIISKCCKGKRHIAYKYKWKYVE